MKKKEVLHHNAYYFYQFLVFVIGGFAMYYFKENLSLQLNVLMFILFSYIIMGFVHHGLNHDLKPKVVVEYILISSLILACFLFFNAGRI